VKQGPAALTNNKQENEDQIQAAIDFLFSFDQAIFFQNICFGFS
jgi:hypothetical protein